jgi:hypothetical protein
MVTSVVLFVYAPNLVFILFILVKLVFISVVFYVILFSVAVTLLLVANISAALVVDLLFKEVRLTPIYVP